MNMGTDKLAHARGADCAPEGLDAPIQDLAHLLNFEKPTRATYGYVVKSDPLRQEAGTRLRSSDSSLGALEAALRLLNANLPSREKSSVDAGARGALAMVGIIQNSRRLSGCVRVPLKRDVPFATKGGSDDDVDTDVGARASYIPFCKAANKSQLAPKRNDAGLNSISPEPG